MSKEPEAVQFTASLIPGSSARFEGLQARFRPRYVTSDCTGDVYIPTIYASIYNAGEVQLAIDVHGDLYSYAASQGPIQVTQASTLYTWGCSLNSGALSGFQATLEYPDIIDQFTPPFHLEHVSLQIASVPLVGNAANLALALGILAAFLIYHSRRLKSRPAQR